LNADLRVLNPFIEVGDIFEVEASVTGEQDWGDLTGFGFDVEPATILLLAGGMTGMGVFGRKKMDHFIFY